MSHVFVSTSSKDGEIAQAVCVSLEQNGIKCWIAPRDILPGMDWGAAIVQAIKQSSVIVLIFSSNSNRSNQVKREIERATSKDVPILVFRVENIEPSESLEYHLSTHHWMDAIAPTEEHFQKLAEVVKALLKNLADNSQFTTQDFNLSTEDREEAREPRSEDKKEEISPQSAQGRRPPTPRAFEELPKEKNRTLIFGVIIGAIVLGFFILLYKVMSPRNDPANNNNNPVISNSNSNDLRTNAPNSPNAATNIIDNSNTNTESSLIISEPKVTLDVLENNRRGLRFTYELTTKNYKNQQLAVNVLIFNNPLQPVKTEDSYYRTKTGELAGSKIVTPPDSPSKQTVEIFMPYSVMPRHGHYYKAVVWSGVKIIGETGFGYFLFDRIPANKSNLKIK